MSDGDDALGVPLADSPGDLLELAREVALEAAPNREALKMALKGIDVSQGGII